MANVIQLDPKGTAVVVRKILKQAFPGTKFSVVTERGSMVSSIRIKWTDGPTLKQVEYIVGNFEAGSFDSMTDCYNYAQGADRYIMVDDQMYQTGCRYVFTVRSISPELASKCIAQVAAYWGGVEQLPTAVEGYDGYTLVPESIGRQPVRADLDWHRNDWYTSIHRCAEEPTEFTRDE